MLLSQAILAGVQKRTRQAFGSMFRGSGSCVLGAAYEGARLGVYDQTLQLQRVQSLFPSEWQMEKYTRCPWCMHTGAKVDVLMHMNDHHTMTRQTIAEHVASWEATAALARELVGA
jgi:hypothetical protein